MLTMTESAELDVWVYVFAFVVVLCMQVKIVASGGDCLECDDVLFVWINSRKDKSTNSCSNRR